MTYSSGTLIQATDYNALAWGGTQGTYTASPTNIAYVMGVGSGAIGYGQPVTAINTVAAAGSVTAVQWSGLLTTLNTALGHQSGAGAQLTVSPTITAGNKITYFSTVATAVTTINTNAALYTAQGATTTGSLATTNIGAGSTTGVNSYTDHIATFSSGAQAARYFFNAGGYLNVRVSATDLNGSASSQSFVRVINAVGGITQFRQTTNAGRSGSGLTQNTNNTAYGYRNNVQGVANTLVQVTDTTAAYTANYSYLQVYGASPDTTNGANGYQVCFRLGYVVADHSWDDTINATLNFQIDVVYPESTYLTTNSWGTVSIS